MERQKQMSFGEAKIFLEIVSKIFLEIFEVTSDHSQSSDLSYFGG